MHLISRRLIAPSLALLLITASMARAQEQQLGVPDGIDPEMVKDAGNKAIVAVLNDMLAHNNFPKRFAILPLQRDIDGDYFTLQLRNEFATMGQANGYQLFTRMDDEWKNLLNEIKWGQQYGDTMDPATVQKFGRIQGVQGIITGRVVSISKDDKDDPQNGQPIKGVRVRFILQAFEVETGQLLWGGEKVGVIDAAPAFQPPPAPEPINWKQIALYAVGAFVALLILIGVIRVIGNASRPR